MSATEDTSFARLVSLACHDLRTPLATAHGFARTLTRSGGLEEPESRYADVIGAATDQLAELLDLLGLAARIEAGRYDPELQTLDSAALAETAAARLGVEQARVSGSGAPVQVDAAAAADALYGLGRCALRHGGLEVVELSVDGPEVGIGPVTPAAAPILLGEDLRDLGAAVAVRVVAALGGSTRLDGERLRVRFPV